MAIQLINVGETPEDTTADSIRTAFIKCNYNFTELYNYASEGLREWTFVESDYTAFKGDRILVDTSNGEVTITLPSTPVQGDYVQIADAWNFSINNLLIVSQQTVEGFDEDIRINIRGLFIEFIYGDGTWKILTSLGVQGPPGPPGEVEEGRAYNIDVIDQDNNVLISGETSTVNLNGTVRDHIIPDQDSEYDLGSLDKQWRSLYVSNDTIYLGGHPISVVDNTLTVGSIDGSTVVRAATEDYVDSAIASIEIDSTTELSHLELTRRREFLGDSIEFIKVSGQPGSDEIDSELTLTRTTGQGGGLYNSAVEDEWDSLTSPVGTLWNAEGWANLDTVTTRYYQPFRQTLRNRIGENVVGAELVMWDTANNKYYTVMFSSWDRGPGHGGGFAYTRQLLDTSTPVGITYPDGTIQATASREFWDEPQIFVGENYTYVLGYADRGHHIYALNSAIQVPSNLQVEFPIGTTVRIISNGGPVRVIPCECVTPTTIYRNGVEEPSDEWIISAYSSSTLTKVDVNTWRLTADDALTGQGGSGDLTPVLPYVELTNNPFIFEPYAGELVSFSKEDYATGPEAVDAIDDSIALTRGENQGIYNPILETQWDDNNNDGTSPLGTLWNTDGWGDLTDLNTRNYYSFYDAYLGRIGNNILSSEAVMKDVANDRYYKFEFTVWGQSWQGAPVSYTRTEIDPVTGETVGDPVLFEKVGYADPTEVNDPIDEGVTLARGNNQGLFNIAQETEWNDQGDGQDSPEGTLWNADGWGKLNDVKSRTYVPFREALGYAIGENIINTELVMWDTINDKYWAFKFSSWTRNSEGGGFAYTRQQINTSQLFVKTDNGDEVDIISESLHITRGNQGWLYNPLEEEGHDDDTPTGSVWNNDGWDDFSDIETRTYVSLADIWGGNFENIPGAKMVMRDETTGKYWAIQFLTWTQGQNGGGFSYLRYELDLDQLQEGVKFADGTVLKTAAGLGRVKLTAPGNRRIEEVAGYKSVTLTERVTQAPVSATIRDTRTDYYIFIDWDQDLYNLYNGDTDFGLEFSLDNNTWYAAELVGSSFETFLQIYIVGDIQLSVTQGNTVFYRLITGGDPVVWWDKNDLPGGGSNFRGAVIDYHAYTGEATWIGTIHIVDDDGEEHITHTEVSSGSSDSENDDLWLVPTEGRISYRRIDGEAKTLKVQWTAKVFYGSELYD